MAYISVAEWSPDQVTDWLKGLDESMDSYVHSFTNNEVGGRQLLNIRPYELEQWGMNSIGHQEIVLEAVENLRNFHYNLDKENLQFMALHVATAAGSLHRQLAAHCNASKIETQILNDITRTIATIKPLIGWLDRSPFQGQYQFTELCKNMLRLGLEMATIAQRDRFVERPAEQIRGAAEKLERLANYIIQDITDPMILQPASLNLVTLKKRESDLGFNIESSYHGVHRIIDIKYNSPAHNSGKIEGGDEIVQINYQTVVGWKYKMVMAQVHESLPDILLTLKKRPKHTKIYGQIYMQPYRLPSKKRTMGARWGDNLPSPRAGFLTVPEVTFNLPKSLKAEEKVTAAVTAALSDSDSSCSDILTPTDIKDSKNESRLYYPKPRSMLQRRNTICGDELLSHKGLHGVPLWHDRRTGTAGDASSPSLRDKSVSFGFGLELTPRPTTCIGIASGTTAGKFVGNDIKDLFGETKKINSATSSDLHTISTDLIEDKSKPGVSKVVRFDANMKYEDYTVDEKYTCNVENTILETFEPIPFVDEEEEDLLDTQRSCIEKTKDFMGRAKFEEKLSSSFPLVEVINAPLVARRGRLDKSHSTPAYDNSGEESDTPPAIEPRKEFLQQTPPVPPPRPRKPNDVIPPVVPPPPPKPASLQTNLPINCTNDTKVVKGVNQSLLPSEMPANVSELHTPTKARTLTLKKKHSLIAKRRNVNLKILGTGDIQGHLYRRTKDRRGVTFWARLYFVMLDTILYGFRLKDAPRASCVIFLPGFTVSLAKEVHSKPFAFKVYHSAKTFYFAAESEGALNQWLSFIHQSTLPMNSLSYPALNSDCRSPAADMNTKDLFSETDSSAEESESVINKNLCTPSPQASKDITAGLSPGLKMKMTPTVANKHERRYLGSLRKLTKNSLNFKSSSHGEKKVSSDIPVPTDQYRSYRKVPGGSFGIQIGTNTPGYHSDDKSPHTRSNPSEMAYEDNSAMQERKEPLSSRGSIISNIGDKPVDCLKHPPASPLATTHTNSVITDVRSSNNTISSNNSSPNSSFEESSSRSSEGIKKIPYNFIHASNPNLVEFDFQTSKTLDYSLPKINPSNPWEAHHNIQGFVTLKDLMLQKQEEEAQEMYNNRVFLGVEKKYERKQREAFKRGEEKLHDRGNSSSTTTAAAANYQQHSDYGGGKISKTQSRSLPKTPDYEISFKPDDENIKRTRTKEGLKLRDFGYELISGDEPIGGGGNTSRHNSNASTSSDHYFDQNWARQFLSYTGTTAQKSKKQSIGQGSTSSDFCVKNDEKRSGSFKKRGKLETFKSERIFQFNKNSLALGIGGGGGAGGGLNLSGMTMTLPLNRKSNQTTENATKSNSGSGIKKSRTYNNDLKDKVGDKYEAHRKNSAPIPIFSKLATLTSSGALSANNNNNSNKHVKDKKLLGSPLLHRTLFGNYNHQHDISNPITPTLVGREYDHEIFSQVIFPKVTSYHSENGSKFRKLSSASTTTAIPTPTESVNITAPDVEAPPPPQTPSTPSQNCEGASKTPNSDSNATTPDYPNMECPPVFKPEIYSLTDSNASLSTLLRQKSNSNSIDEQQ